MSKKSTKVLNALLCCAALATFLTSSATAAQGIQQGLILCAEVVIPSLFPFMILAGFITRSGAASVISKPLAKVMCPLFRLPESACSSVIISLISGYPSGAALVKRLFEQGQIDRRTAARMLTFCVNAGPAMVIIAVGECMLNSSAVGWLLFACHIGASMIIGIVGARFAPKPQTIMRQATPSQPPSIAFVDATADACSQMMLICGYVALFSSITAMIPEQASLLTPIIEVTKGTLLLSRNGFGLVAISAALGFGGLCVICQVLSLSSGLISPAKLLLSRFIHAAISVLLCSALIKLLPGSIETMSTGTQIATQFTAMSVPLTLSMLVCASTLLWSSAYKK